MAVRGSQAKSEITKKILETFEGSFIMPDGKEIRIPMMEDGALIQIKVGLTAAKENVENTAGSGHSSPVESQAAAIPTGSFEMTVEEKQEVVDLIHKLNL